MEAVIVGDVLVTNLSAVCTVLIKKSENADEKESVWHVVVFFTNRTHHSAATAKTIELAAAKVAKYAADLGLILLTPTVAVRRDNILALYVLHIAERSTWEVCVKTSIHANYRITVFSCDSHDGAYVHMHMLYAQHFILGAAANTTPQ